MILADVSPAPHGYKLDASAVALAFFGCSVIRFSAVKKRPGV
jgi:hypothetical protein